MKNNHFFFYLIVLGFIALSCDPDPVTSTYPQHFAGASLKRSPSKVYLMTDDAGQYKEINKVSWLEDADTLLGESLQFIDSIELPHAFTLLDDKKMEFETGSGIKFPTNYTMTTDGIEAKWLESTDSSTLKLYWGIKNKDCNIPLITSTYSKATGKVNVQALNTELGTDLKKNVASIIQTKKLKKNDTLWVNWSHKVYTLK